MLLDTAKGEGTSRPVTSPNADVFLRCHPNADDPIRIGVLSERSERRSPLPAPGEGAQKNVQRVEGSLFVFQFRRE